MPTNVHQGPSTTYVVSGDGSAAQSLISALDTNTTFDATNTLLATVSINVMDKQGRPHTCRAVLDSASQVSFISESFCKELSPNRSQLNRRINLLLGIELFFQLLEPGKINLGPDDNFPMLQNIKLGWVVAGRYRDANIPSYATSPTCFFGEFR